MPRDDKGNFHISGLRPVEGKLPGGKAISKPAGKVEGGVAENSEKITTLHDHGDGTFHSEGHDGQREEHPDIGHALTHIGHMHAEGKHFHAHHDGMTMHSHGVNEAGEHQGTDDHENIDELKESMGRFLDEEGKEGHGSEAGDEYDEKENGGQLGGFGG
jgi:hypothetical protein